MNTFLEHFIISICKTTCTELAVSERDKIEFLRQKLSAFFLSWRLHDLFVAIFAQIARCPPEIAFYETEKTCVVG